MIQLYGIPNCDTVKKARAWLDARGIAYGFHDYKKEGADLARLGEWSDAVGWDTLLNRRGTTFRGLADADKTAIDRAKALHLMAKHPSLIKRPVVEYPGGVLVGFDAAAWERALA
jgi:arsenate reductase